jgi:hypothetical protein
LDPTQAPSASLPTAPKKRKHHLTASKDTLLGEIRDLNFAVVGTRLSRLARRLEGDFGGAKNLKSVSQMKEFVGKIGGLQSEQQNLRLRESPDSTRLEADETDTGLTELLMPITRTDEFGKNLEAQQNLVAGYSPNDQLTVLEDLMAQQVPWQSVLRSVVLMSLTSGGIKVKNLEAFKRDFLQVSLLARDCQAYTYNADLRVSSPVSFDRTARSQSAGEITFDGATSILPSPQSTPTYRRRHR